MSNHSKAAARALGVDAAATRNRRRAPGGAASVARLAAAARSMRHQQGRDGARGRLRLSRAASDRAGRGAAHHRHISADLRKPPRPGEHAAHPGVREPLSADGPGNDHGSGADGRHRPGGVARRRREGSPRPRGRGRRAGHLSRPLSRRRHRLSPRRSACPLSASAAKVKGPCGEWPDDLASGGSLDGWQNTTYWNFGCANQATLAAQIADPRDLVEPRGETPGDVETRMRAIQKVRQGADPGTGWAAKAQATGGN